MATQRWAFGPSTSSLEWTDPADRSKWTVEFTWQGPVAPTNAIECVAVALRPAGTPKAFTTSRMRRLNLATLIGREKAKLAATLRRAAEAPVPWEHDDDRFGATARASKAAAAGAANSLRPRSAQVRPGRPARYEREHFEEVARVYRENYSGLTSTPTKAVAERFGVTPATAKKWVSRTRQMGLLGPTDPGRAGGTEPRRRRRWRGRPSLC